MNITAFLIILLLPGGFVIGGLMLLRRFLINRSNKVVPNEKADV